MIAGDDAERDGLQHTVVSCYRLLSRFRSESYLFLPAMLDCSIGDMNVTSSTGDNIYNTFKTASSVFCEECFFGMDAI